MKMVISLDEFNLNKIQLTLFKIMYKINFLSNPIHFEKGKSFTVEIYIAVNDIYKKVLTLDPKTLDGEF